MTLKLSGDILGNAGIFEPSIEDNETIIFQGGQEFPAGKIYKIKTKTNTTEYSTISLEWELQTSITLNFPAHIQNWMPLFWKFVGEVKHDPGGGGLNETFACCSNTDIGDTPTDNTLVLDLATASAIYVEDSEIMSFSSNFDVFSGPTTFKIYLQADGAGTAYLKNFYIEFYYLTDIVVPSIGDQFGAWA